MSIEHYIEQMKAEAIILEALHKQFPDLEITKDRWGREHFQAKSANAQVTDVLLQHNCGCCVDSPLEARPCLTVNGKVIHGVPYSVYVGSGTHEGYDKWESDWKERIIEHGYPQLIVDQLEARYQESLIDEREANEE